MKKLLKIVMIGFAGWILAELVDGSAKAEMHGLYKGACLSGLDFEESVKTVEDAWADNGHGWTRIKSLAMLRTADKYVKDHTK